MFFREGLLDRRKDMRTKLFAVLALVILSTINADTKTKTSSRRTPLPYMRSPLLARATRRPVVRVIDGDTFVVSIDGKEVAVRMIQSPCLSRGPQAFIMRYGCCL